MNPRLHDVVATPTHVVSGPVSVRELWSGEGGALPDSNTGFREETDLILMKAIDGTESAGTALNLAARHYAAAQRGSDVSGC